MNNEKLNEKLALYLNKIVTYYIKTGEPVASKTLIEAFDLNISSATIRNVMAELEKSGYLIKAHVSSGRIPSTLGYKYYANHLNIDEDKALKRRLEDIFAKRWASIDTVVDEAAKAIQEIVGLTLVMQNYKRNELLKSITLTPLNLESVIIVLVTSNGRVENKILNLSEKTKIKDVQIAVRLFKERLVDTPIYDLNEKAKSLQGLLKENIKDFEFIIQNFVQNVFNFKEKQDIKIYGKNEIIKQKDVSRKDLFDLLNKIENESIWESMESEATDDQSLKIGINSNNTTFISKKLEYKKDAKEITIIGSNRMDYSKATSAIKLLESFMKRQN